MDKRNSFFISGGTIKNEIDKKSKPLTITHLHDLVINFPSDDLLPPTKVS